MSTIVDVRRLKVKWLGLKPTTVVQLCNGKTAASFPMLGVQSACLMSSLYHSSEQTEIHGTSRYALCHRLPYLLFTYVPEFEIITFHTAPSAPEKHSEEFWHCEGAVNGWQTEMDALYLPFVVCQLSCLDNLQTVNTAK